MPKSAMHKIIIVDDQKEESGVWQAGLKSIGHDIDVSVFISGEEALLDSDGTDIDLLISSVTLSGISGIELTSKLKTSHPDVKAILLSDSADNETKQAAADAGADAYFVKPLELADLLDSAERNLGLVETMLPTEMQVDKVQAEHEKPQTISLSERVTSLRQELEAECVYLMNDLGQVLVRAGEMPDKEIETKLAADLMAVTFTNNRISTFLGDRNFDNFSFFGGNTFDLTIFPVGQNFALLLATKKDSDTNIEVVTDAMTAAVKDIFSTLYILGLVTKAGVTGELRKDNTGMLIDPDMDSVFQKAKSKQINTGEIKAFWQTLPQLEEYNNVADGNRLSYDEASELGLTPAEDEN